MRICHIEDLSNLNKNAEAVIVEPNCEDFKKCLQVAFYYKFKQPIVRNEKNIKNPYLLLARDQEEKDDNFEVFLNRVDFALKNYNNSSESKVCSNYIILSKESIKYLENYVKNHRIKTKTGYEQREISGIFNIYPISDNMLEVSIDLDSINTGELETASHKNTIGSFHTHPLDAYIKYNVCIAFPSADDYFTTLHIYASGYGVFHITSTLEGIYIITIKKSFMKEDRNKILKNFEDYKDHIEETYGMDYPVCDPRKDNRKFWRKYLVQYIKKINKLKYFKVQFIFWEDAHKPIKVEYGQINNNCLISDKQIDIIRKINS